MEKECSLTNHPVSFQTILGDVRDKTILERVFASFRLDVVFHAAAYKHVPMQENHPWEAILTNIQGTLNLINIAEDSTVNRFVLVSTDKAVNPTNIMGATKRIAEKLIQSKSLDSSVKYMAVRFGNVIGSSGSVIPTFQEQIKNGGPVTVTDPEVIRYFMTIPEAAELVIQAGAMGGRGDIFVLDMGEPVKILDLARRMIKLSGMEIRDENNPEGDIEIIFTGLRPGEKLYEELLIEGDVSDTSHSQILKAEEDYIIWEEMEEFIKELKKVEEKADHKALINIFMKTVSGYKPNEEIQDVLYEKK